MESHFTSFPTPTDQDVSPALHSDPKTTKKPRNRHSPYQLAALNELYEQNDHPPLQDRKTLAERISMWVPQSLFTPSPAHFFCCGLGLYLADVTNPFIPPRMHPFPPKADQDPQRMVPKQKGVGQEAKGERDRVSPRLASIARRTNWPTSLWRCCGTGPFQRCNRLDSPFLPDR